MKNSDKTAQERETVPFYSEDCANLGQSPAVLLKFLSYLNKQFSIYMICEDTTALSIAIPY
jgi:hypothetical protein